MKKLIKKLVTHHCPPHFSSLISPLSSLISHFSFLFLAFAFAGTAMAAHTHCVCGDGKCTTGGHTHSSLTWTEWTSTDSLPSAAGNYYLANDIVLTSSLLNKMAWLMDGVKLCLNGHSIIQKNDDLVTVLINEGATAAITDCATNPGAITHAPGVKGQGLSTNGKGIDFTFWRGRVCGNNYFNIQNYAWGAGMGVSAACTGTFHNVDFYDNSVTCSGNNALGGAICSAGVVNIYGGTYRNNSSGTYGGALAAAFLRGASQGGIVNVYGGVFTNNVAENGGAAATLNSSSPSPMLNIHGGLFASNTVTGASQGGAIYADARVTIDGGIIRDNVCDSGCGGGIYVTGYSAALTLGGAVTITNNTSNGVDNNVYLCGGRVITVSTTKPLAADVKIGVTTQIEPPKGGYVKVTDETGAGLANHFISERPVYKVMNAGSPVVIANPSQFYVSASGSDTNAGTLDKPLKTLQAACGKITSIGTIALLSDIDAPAGAVQALTVTGGKTITVTSAKADGDLLDNAEGDYTGVHTIRRADNTSSLIYVQNGNLALEQVIVSGGAKSFASAGTGKGCLVYMPADVTAAANDTLSLGVNAILRDNVNLGSDGVAQGSAVLMGTSDALTQNTKIYMSANAAILGCVAPRQGGAVTIYDGDLQMSGNAKVMYNGVEYGSAYSQAYVGGGAIFAAGGNVRLSGNATIAKNYVQLNDGSDGGRAHASVCLDTGSCGYVKDNARIFDNYDDGRLTRNADGSYALVGTRQANAYGAAGSFYVDGAFGADARIGVAVSGTISVGSTVVANGTDAYTVTSADANGFRDDAQSYKVAKHATANTLVFGSAVTATTLTLGTLTTTSLTGTFGAAIGATAGDIAVFKDGVKLESGYTVTVSGTALTIAFDPALPEKVTIGVAVSKNGYKVNDGEVVSVSLHRHCLCGAIGSAAHCAADHDKTVLDWKPWTATDSLPTSAGNWYLMNDVTLAAAYTPADGVNLCLNGHVVKQTTSGQRVVTISSDATFQLTDCDLTTVHNFKVGSDGLWTLTEELKTIDFEDLTARPAANAVVAVKGGVLTGGTLTGGNPTTGDGGGILCYGTLWLFNGNIVGNRASNMSGGVGMYDFGNPEFHMTGGKILGNVGGAYGGGGVGLNDGGSCEFIDGTIGYNTASEGGGVGTGGRFIMSGGQIVGNKATSATDGWGGGVDEWGLSKGGFVITGGRIAGNIAAKGGAGVYVWNGGGYYGKLTIGGDALIAGNTVNAVADNVYLTTSKTLVITNAPALAAGAQIGVTSANVPTLSTPVAITDDKYASADQISFFTPDKPGHGLAFSAARFYLTGLHYVKVKPATVPHASASVSTNGVAIALVSGEGTVLSNMPNVKVVYTVESGYEFVGGVTSWSTNLTANASLVNVSVPDALLPVRKIHTHCICGTGTCTVGGHTSHSDITFEPWTSTNSIPQGTPPGSSTSKYYYLVNDVTLQAVHTNWGNVCICLNGKVVRHKNFYKGNPAVYPTNHATDGRIICITNGLLQITECDTTTVHNYEVCKDERWLLTDKAATRNFEDLTERPAVGDVIALKGGAITGGNAWRYEGGAIMLRRDVNIWGGNFVGNSPCALGLPKSSSYPATLRIYGGNIVGNRGETLNPALTGSHVVNGGGGISFSDAGTSYASADCNGGVVYLYDGRVDFNIAPSGGGVRTGGLFSMSGGTIAYNKATSSTNGFGGGILSFGLKWGGAVLTGGTITKNTAVLGGGGVYVMNDAANSTANPGAVSNKGVPTGNQMYGKVTVGGTIVIQDNYLTNGVPDNVYLENASQNTEKNLYSPAPTLFITNAPALAAGAKIGVTTATLPTLSAPVAVTTNFNASAAQSVYFTPDKYGCGIAFLGNRFYLTGLHYVKVVPGDVANVTASVLTNGVPVALVSGEGLVLSNMPNAQVVYTANPGYYFADYSTAVTNDVDATKNPAVLPAAPSAPAIHKHCLCGASGSDPHCAAAHTQTELTWTPWTSTTTLPTTAGNWYLANDVTLAATYVPPTGVNLCLNGHVVKGNDSFTLVSVESGAAFQLTDCDKVTSHHFSVNATGYWTLTDADKTVDYEDLTARPNAGDVVALTGGVLTGGAGGESSAGGIAVKGVFTMYGGTLVGNCNMQKHGGAIYIGKNNSYSATLAGGRICGNYAEGCGGAVQQDGGCTSNLRLCGTDVSFNAAGDKGGAVNSDAAVTVTGGRIAYNKAAGPGCAMRLVGTATLTGGSITHNESSEAGSLGAVYFAGSSSCVVGGTLLIDANYVAGNTRNLYLAADKKLAVSTETPFKSGAKISVTLAVPPATKGTTAAFTTNGADTDRAYFTTDDLTYTVVYDTDHLAIRYPQDWIEILPDAPSGATAVVKQGEVVIEPDNFGMYMVEKDTPDVTVVYTLTNGCYFTDWTTNRTCAVDTSTNPAEIQNKPTVVPEHKHCICGDGACTAEGHTHSPIIWTPWAATDSLPTTAGNYYLAKDVTLTATYEPVDGVSLCLNGRKVNITVADKDMIAVASGRKFVLTDCQGDTGRITTDGLNCGNNQAPINNAGTFEFYGGMITNCVTKDSSGGLRNTGTAYMYGGIIADCHDLKNGGYARGGGVYNAGTFHLLDGIITECSSEKWGGGVVNHNGTMYMCGGEIRDNTGDGIYCGTLYLTGGIVTGNTGYGLTARNADGWTCAPTVGGDLEISDNASGNLYLWSCTAAISTTTPLVEGASIGVTMRVPSGLAAITSNGATTDVDKFSSDDPGYCVRYASDHLVLWPFVEIVPPPRDNTFITVFVNGEELAKVGGKYLVPSNATDTITIRYVSDSDNNYFFADKTTEKFVTLESSATSFNPATIPSAQVPDAPTDMPAVTVSFDMMGHGEAIPDQRVAIGGVVRVATKPTDPDYKFQCWCRESDIINAWDMTNTVSSAMTLYAAWAKVLIPKKPTADGWVTPYGYNASASAGVRLAVGAKDLFFGNDYIELGMHRNGAFGTYDPAPANFHGQYQNKRLGLRASKSGWGKGDDPNGTYTHDFFMPGTVDEGWMIGEANTTKVAGRYGAGTNTENDRKDMRGTNLTGDPVLSMKVTGEAGTTNETLSVKTVVQSTVGYEIEQVIVFTKEDTGYDTWVTIRNTTDSDKNDVAYYRAFDPDQGRGNVGGGSASTDNFYHTEPNGDVYVIASGMNTGLPSPTTLNDMCEAAKGAYIFFAPLFDFGYTVTPMRTSVGWASYPSQLKAMEEGFHEYDDKAMGIRANLGTIPAHGEKTLYYYSSLDPDTKRALQKLSGKGAGSIPAPELTSANVTDDVVWYEAGVATVDVTLWETNATSGKIYLANKKCTSFEELANATNQLVSGKLVQSDGSATFTLPASEGGPYYAYYVSPDNVVSKESEFYVAEFKTVYALTFDANGGTLADGSTVTNVLYTRWTRTQPIADPVPPSSDFMFCGWYTNHSHFGISPFVFGERLIESTTLYAGWRAYTGIHFEGDGRDLAEQMSGDGWSYDEANQVVHIANGPSYKAFTGSSTNTTFLMDGTASMVTKSFMTRSLTLDHRESGLVPVTFNTSTYPYYYYTIYGLTNSIYTAPGVSPIVISGVRVYLGHGGNSRLFLYPGEGAEAVTILNGGSLVINGGTFNQDSLKKYVDTASGYFAFDNGDGTWTATVGTWVTYNLQGIGGTNFTQIVKRYQPFTPPENPSAEGYTFGGWYQDAACTTPYTAWQSNDKTLVLYAKWTVGVTFNAVGGAFADGSDVAVNQTIFNGKYQLPATPTRKDYTFLGWYAGVTNGALEVTASTAYQSVKAQVVFAKWSKTAVTPAGDADVVTGEHNNGGLFNVYATNAYANGSVVFPDRVGNQANGLAIVSIKEKSFAPAQYEEKIPAPAITSVTIPAFVTEIGMYAFWNNEKLGDVKFAPAHDYKTGEKATLFIRNCAFKNCAITNLVFPAGSSFKLGNFAFANNPQLKNVYIYGDVTLDSFESVPFSEVGDEVGGTVFHLSPAAFANTKLVTALTNGLHMASVRVSDPTASVSDVPAGKVEVGAFSVEDEITVEFALPADAPWQTVTTETVSLLYSNDPTKLIVGKCEKIAAKSVEKVGDLWKAKFDKPTGATGFFTVCVGN